MGLLDENYKELRRKITEDNVRKLNQYRYEHGKAKLMTDEEVKAEVDKLMNNQKKLEIYKLAKELEEKRKQLESYSERLASQVRAEHPDYKMCAGIERYFYYLLKDQNEPGADEANKKIILELGDPEKVKNILSKDFEKLVKTDKSKLYTGSLEEIFKNYKENYNLFNKAFIIESAIGSTHFVLNKPYVDLLAKDKNFIQCAMTGQDFTSFCSNEIFLTVPEDVTDEECLMLSNHYESQIGKYVTDYNVQDNSVSNAIYMGHGSVGFAGKMNAVAETGEKIKEYITSGKAPEGYETDYKYTENGKELTVYDGISKLATGTGNVVMTKKSPELIASQKELWGNVLIDGRKFISDKVADIRKLYNELVNSGHWYSITREHYRNLKTCMERIINTSKNSWNTEKFLKDCKDMTTAAKAYVTEKRRQNRIDSIRSHRMNICDRIEKQFGEKKLDHDLYFYDKLAAGLHEQALRTRIDVDMKFIDNGPEDPVREHNDPDVSIEMPANRNPELAMA